MATAVVFESLTPAVPLIAETPVTTHLPVSRWDAMAQRVDAAVEAEQDTEPVPMGPTARNGNNLAAAVLLLAVEDYQRGNTVDHESARKFLYPELPAAKEHLEAIVGLMNGLSITALREGLDRMRDTWLAERKIWLER
jgi:hypothetical protein